MRLLRITLICLPVLAALGWGGWIGLRSALRYEPPFYAAAIERPLEQQVADSDALEKQLLELHNQVRRRGHWEAEFSEDQVNGWLAVDLQRRLPQMLPTGVADPRVEFQQTTAQLACRYQRGGIACVVSAAIEIHLTDEPNRLAFRVCQARAGALPLPLSKYLERIGRSARQAGLKLRWTEAGGDPVAVVQIQPRHPEFPDRQIVVETVELLAGRLRLTGRTIDPDAASGPASVAAQDEQTSQLQR